MQALNPTFITDTHNNKVAVQLKIEKFEKIEEILEISGLYHLMEETEPGEFLNLKDAKTYSSNLKKKQ